MSRQDIYQINRMKYLSIEETAHMEAFLKRLLGTKDERDAIIILLALRTGGRATELLNIRRADFCYDSKTILIRGIKRSMDREIPLPDFLARSVKTYLDRLNGDIPFDFTYNRLRQIWHIYRPPSNKKFHSLRHTFAIKTYMLTRDIRLTQLALGHRSIANTMVYVDYVYSMTELQRIVY